MSSRNLTPLEQQRLAWGVGPLAKALGLSSRHLWQLIASGKLPAFKSGRRTLVADADAKRFFGLNPDGTKARTEDEEVETVA